MYMQYAVYMIYMIHVLSWHVVAVDDLSRILDELSRLDLRFEVMVYEICTVYIQNLE